MRNTLIKWLACCLIAGLLLPLLPAANAAEPIPQSSPQPAAYGYAEVTTEKGTLNMRKEPMEGAKVLNRLGKGAIVRVIGTADGWANILFQGESGYVKSDFLQFYDTLPYSPITGEEKGSAVMAFKRMLCQLDYLKADQVNQRWDAALTSALIRLQLQNGIPLNPNTVTPELQALLEWGLVQKGKSGYVDIATDETSGLTVGIFCWDTAGMLYEEDQSVKVEITYGAQATGGYPPYTITVRKSRSASGGEIDGDIVTNPFSHIVGQNGAGLYVYATVTDAQGNTVTASTPFEYRLPERYTGLG